LRSNSKIKVVIAEHHQLHRDKIRCLLTNLEKIEIAGEANNGIQTFDVIEDSKPDRAIINVSMLEFQGFDFIPIIKSKSSKTKALLIASIPKLSLFQTKILSFSNIYIYFLENS